MCSPTYFSFNNSTLHTFAPLHVLLAMPHPAEPPTNVGTVSRITTARGTRSARSPLKHWRDSAPVPCKYCSKPPTLLAPSQGTSVPSAPPICIAGCLRFGVVISATRLLRHGPPHCRQQIQLDQSCNPTLPRGSAVGMQVLPWLQPAAIVQSLRVGCFLFNAFCLCPALTERRFTKNSCCCALLTLLGS
jgi:hypothetical protein